MKLINTKIKGLKIIKSKKFLKIIEGFLRETYIKKIVGLEIIFHLMSCLFPKKMF